MKNYPMPSFPWSFCVPVHDRNDSAKNPEPATEIRGKQALITGPRKTGGLKAISVVLVNETFERLASFGIFANFMVYLTRQLHMDPVSASNIMNIWFGVTNFAPLVGAFIADAYIGRFWTIGFSSFFSLLGMITVTLTAWLPNLHPPLCTNEQQKYGQCIETSQTQLVALILGLTLISIGTGGIRPCSIPFGVDQFDPATERGRKGIASFFNWYYTTFTLVLLVSQTVILYIQDQISWVIGYAIPTVTMAFSIVLFFSGVKLYNHVKPEGSAFTSVARVVVAAYNKRWIEIPDNNSNDRDRKSVVFYDPPWDKKNIDYSKLVHTSQYRFLDKAAVITTESEVAVNGSPASKWRLCSLQNVEELKCLVRVFPIWVCGMISLTAVTQQMTFTVYQATNMDRHLGPHFVVPAGTIGSIIPLLTVVVVIPLYDRVLVPSLRKVTGHENGITLLQRMGIGIVFTVLSMIVAGVVERARRAHALAHPHGPPMSAFWLGPHLVLMGLCEAFNMLGQIEFFNRQFPEHMRSVGNALFPCAIGGASYAGAAVINVVRHVSISGELPRGWLTTDLNQGRYDYFYFLMAGLGAANLGLFLYCAKRYTYKETINNDVDNVDDVEMSSSTKTSIKV